MTVQACDSIYYMGEVHPLYSQPMNHELLQAWGPGISTGHLKGYVAEWKIDDNALFLVGFRDLGTSLSISLSDLPLHAEWFSGELRVQDGKEVGDDSHFEFGSVYEREIVLKLQDGVVVSSEVVAYRPSEAILRWRSHRRNVEACPICRGAHLVCAAHPTEPSPHDECDSNGVPCACNPGGDDEWDSFLAAMRSDDCPDNSA